LGAFFSGIGGYIENNTPVIKEFLGLRPEHEIIVGFGLGYPDVTYYRTAPWEDVEVIWK
jgi:hypothetical protein